MCHFISLRLAAVGLVGWLLGTSALGFQISPSTATPIKHVVVIFQENNSFDHYFATDPNAANPPGEPAFVAKLNTPSVNGVTGPLSRTTPIQPRHSGWIAAKRPLMITTTITPTSKKLTTVGSLINFQRLPVPPRPDARLLL
jgi:phospholipase C